MDFRSRKQRERKSFDEPFTPIEWVIVDREIAFYPCVWFPVDIQEPSVICMKLLGEFSSMMIQYKRTEGVHLTGCIYIVSVNVAKKKITHDGPKNEVDPAQGEPRFSDEKN